MNTKNTLTDNDLRKSYIQSDEYKIRKGYEDYIPELLKIKDIKPTHFVTLIFTKNVTEEDCMDAYRVFLGLLKNRVYGKYNKRRKVKQITILERNKSGYLHIHGLFECDDYDDIKLSDSERVTRYFRKKNSKKKIKYSFLNDWKNNIKDIWEKQIRIGSNVGHKKFDNCKFFEPIDDEKQVYGYITKYFGYDRGKLLEF